MSVAGRISYDYPFCQIQAFVSNSTALALNCWSLAFTLYLYFGVIGHVSFTALQKLYSRIEYVFLFMCLIVIPLPFFIMIFPMPIAGSKPLRYVLLYNHSDKQWCDFANVRRPNDPSDYFDPLMLFPRSQSPIGGSTTNYYPSLHGQQPMSFFRNSTDPSDRVEYSWALWWELGFFYVPNAIMFIISLLFYVRIIFKIRANSKQLEKRKMLQQSRDSTQKEDQATEKKSKIAKYINVFRPSTRDAPATESSPSSAPPAPNVQGAHALSKQTSFKSSSPKKTSSDALSNMISPVISSATPIEYYDMNSSSPATNANLDANVQLILQPFHFRLSRITLNDIEEYAKFLQSQTRTASYYIGVLMLNWVIWIIARVLWEFGDCNLNAQSSRIIFVTLLIFLQCSGPRVECILLSIIYGIAENTVSPNRLSDVFVDLVALRYFKEFCVNKSMTSENTLDATPETPSNDSNTGNTGRLTLWRRVSNLMCCRTSYDNELQINNSNKMNQKKQQNCEFDYDDLLFFWFDVQKMRMAIEKRKTLLDEYHKIMKRSQFGECESPSTIDVLKQQIDFYKKKILEYARDLCSTYFSESAPLPIHRSGIISNIQRNRIRTIVLQEAYMSEDEEGKSEEESESDDTSASAASDAYSSDSDADSVNATPIKISFNTHQNNNNNYSSISGNSGSGTLVIDDDAVVKQDELIKSNKEMRILKLFAEPQRVAYQKLTQLMNEFQSSLLFQELTHVLRMKAVSRSRSLYKDILNRMVFHTFKFIRRGYHTIKNTCAQCCGFSRSDTQNSTMGSFYDADYEYEGYDENERLLGSRGLKYNSMSRSRSVTNRMNTLVGAVMMSSNTVDEQTSRAIKIEDVEIFIYIKEQKKAKMRKKQQLGAFNSF